MNAHRSAVTGQWSLRLACLVAVCLTAVPAFAQFDRGQISGVIKDSSGRGGARRDRDGVAGADDNPRAP